MVHRRKRYMTIYIHWKHVKCKHSHNGNKEDLYYQMLPKIWKNVSRTSSWWDILKGNFTVYVKCKWSSIISNNSMCRNRSHRNMPTSVQRCTCEGVFCNTFTTEKYFKSPQCPFHGRDLIKYLSFILWKWCNSCKRWDSPI